MKIQYITATQNYKENTENHIFIDGPDSIFKKYNKGISMSDNADVFVFVHDDVTIIDTNFENKAQMVFDRFPNIGVIGVIGTKIFNATGGWWMCDRSKDTIGHIMQGHPNGQHNHMVDSIGFCKDMVVVDGCCFLVRSTMFKEHMISFDDKTFSGYHHYDNDVCLQVKEKGFDIAVADILIQHESEGALDEEWNKNLVKLLNKWGNKGYDFPITIESFKNKS